MGNFAFRDMERMHKNIGSYANLPKPGDLVGDCTGTNHVISTVKIHWEPVRLRSLSWNVFQQRSKFPVIGHVLQINVTYTGGSGHQRDVCQCRYDMSYQEPFTYDEVAEYLLHYYGSCLKEVERAMNSGKKLDGSTREIIRALKAEGITKPEDALELIDERGVYLH